jgi:hypothetical protein
LLGPRFASLSTEDTISFVSFAASVSFVSLVFYHPPMIRTELSLRLGNSPGALGAVCRLLSDERVNILAMSLEAGGQLRVVVDNHVHGGAVLREHHHQVAERDVIVTAVPNVPGALAPVLKFVSDASVNVEYAYGGASEGGPTSMIVLGVADAQRAAAAAGV